MNETAAASTLGATSTQDIERALSGSGLVLDLGAMRVRVRSPISALASHLQQVYPEFPSQVESGFCDANLELVQSGGIRRFIRRQARFIADGIEPFEPFPRESTLPLLEWGINWCFAHMFNQHLLLHSGVVEIGDVAMLLVAEPGSGKSTLTAALGLRGGRVLSDEFGVVRLNDGMLLPLPKPIALKNRSIDVIRGWSRDVRMGPVFPKTRKGDVAHVAVSRASAEARFVAARPRLVVFPKWVAGAGLSLAPVRTAEAFSLLTANSFNYGVLGLAAFSAVSRLARDCRFVRLEYSRLEQAVPSLIDLCGHAASERARA
ncbi:MAG: HprK-related kinase A [Burkholderiaceae bacterium]|nr:HprK-related kinase A [Burkholderiaceae bacterium]